MKKIKNILLSVFVIFFSTTISCANNLESGQNIYTVSSAHEVIDILKKQKLFPNKTIAFHDLDDTLWIQKDRILRNINRAPRERRLELLTKSGKSNLVTVLYESAKYIILDKSYPDLMHFLLKLGIDNAGLTARRTGKPSPNAVPVEILTTNYIKEFALDGVFNINLETQYIKVNERKSNKILNDLLPFKEGTGPMVNSGVIFTANHNKAVILDWVLSKINKKHTVILVDDSIKNHESIKSYCIEKNINYYGFLFDAAKTRVDNRLDSKLVDKQFEILELESRWIQESEARVLLDSE